MTDAFFPASVGRSFSAHQANGVLARARFCSAVIQDVTAGECTPAGPNPGDHHRPLRSGCPRIISWGRPVLSPVVAGRDPLGKDVPGRGLHPPGVIYGERQAQRRCARTRFGSSVTRVTACGIVNQHLFEIVG